VIFAKSPDSVFIILLIINVSGNNLKIYKSDNSWLFKFNYGIKRFCFSKSVLCLCYRECFVTPKCLDNSVCTRRVFDKFILHSFLLPTPIFNPRYWCTQLVAAMAIILRRYGKCLLRLLLNCRPL
jgi:hypothetical protein